MKVGDGDGETIEEVKLDRNSGAANSVFNGDDFPNVPREDSEGSRKALVY